jgi:hypothetical protein
MYRTLLDILDARGIRYDEIEGRTSVRIGFALDNGSFDCVAIVEEEVGRFIFLARCPICIPPDKRAAIAEFLTRVNYWLAFGNFEMDYGDGDLRFRACTLMDGDAGLSREVIERAIHISLRMMDKFFPGIMAITYGNGMPEAIFNQLVQQPNPSGN